MINIYQVQLDVAGMIGIPENSKIISGHCHGGLRHIDLLGDQMYVARNYRYAWLSAYQQNYNFETCDYVLSTFDAMFNQQLHLFMKPT
jgi:hypothetical protein